MKGSSLGRPTISDLAKEADVSVATVNRVLAGSAGVRPETRTVVEAAAERIGFYGAAAIQARNASVRPRAKLGFLLHQPGRAFYQELARSLGSACEAVSGRTVTSVIEFLDDLSPQNTAARLLALAARCDALAVVAAVHPLVSDAISELQRRQVPVFALISQLAAENAVPFAGIDQWQVGRTAAWAFDQICDHRGKLAIFVGNHRYRCQEMNEAGFRSYFRELADDFTILEAKSTFETAAIAQQLTEDLLREVPDLSGLFVAGGGITGVVTALRQASERRRIVVVGLERIEVTQRALLDGYLTMVISQPRDRLAAALIDRMLQALDGAATQTFDAVLPFEIFTRENL